jgi:hypothetical protein
MTDDGKLLQGLTNPGGITGTVPAPAPQYPTPPVVSSSVMPQTSALDNWSNAAGMDFLMKQGQRAISGQQAAGGVLNSGATGKALVQYGQGLGSQYLKNYMDYLFDFAKLGLGSASAMSGAGNVGQSQAANVGSSLSGSFGSSSGQSTGTSTSTGASSGSGHSKKGLVPTILG